MSAPARTAAQVPYRVLAVGDVVGSAGRRALAHGLAGYRALVGAALVVVNGENAAGGHGITPVIADEFYRAGADVITGGNHIWAKKELHAVWARYPRLLRPFNYPDGAPGTGYCVLPRDPARPGLFGGREIAVLNLEGRVFMKPLDCPFRALDTLVAGPLADKVLLVDFHAEATSEKQAFGFHCDGRAAAVWGTHTHVQTADERVLAHGTGYITDLGLTGSFNAVIGFEVAPVLLRFKTQREAHFSPADDMPVVQGVVIDLDSESGRCVGISRFRLDAAGAVLYGPGSNGANP
jgi:2',3'-cyclic-nucleotide 2'-phosphodiesterase